MGPEQTHRTLARHLLEETHELLEAIDADDEAGISDELGDLLLQVTFHAQIAADEGRWDIDDVAEGLVAKLVHRHPHVFGDVDVADADEVLVNWERLKAEETGGRKAVDADIPTSLPALARAAKVQRRAAGWGFTWRSVEQALAKLDEEVAELGEAATDPARAEAELGDVLLAAVGVSRLSGSTPSPRSAGRRRGSPLGPRARSRWRPSGASIPPTSPTTSCSRCTTRPRGRDRDRRGARADRRDERWVEDATATRVEPWRFGSAVLTDDFPRRYDSNFLRVEKPVGTTTPASSPPRQTTCRRT